MACRVIFHTRIGWVCSKWIRAVVEHRQTKQFPKHLIKCYANCSAENIELHSNWLILMFVWMEIITTILCSVCCPSLIDESYNHLKSNFRFQLISAFIGTSLRSNQNHIFLLNRSLYRCSNQCFFSIIHSDTSFWVKIPLSFNWKEFSIFLSFCRTNYLKVFPLYFVWESKRKFRNEEITKNNNNIKLIPEVGLGNRQDFCFCSKFDIRRLSIAWQVNGNQLELCTEMCSANNNPQIVSW